MSRIFITGSADGLGQLAATALLAQGHSVVLHARSVRRSQEARQKNPAAEAVLSADLSDMQATAQLAREANAIGTFDAVIHNAGVYLTDPKNIFTVNVLAPYILTCMMHKPARLIYLCSGMHFHGHLDPDHFKKLACTYSDSKLYVLMLCKAVARKWPDVFANAVNPGWVPTKMGGRGAPDDLYKGFETQVWLAASDEPGAKVSGKYFFHQNVNDSNPEADHLELQERLLQMCEEITGIPFPKQ